MNIECKKLNATMPEKTCVLRYGEVKYHNGKNTHKFYMCKNCEKGAEIYEKYLGKKDQNLKICTKCRKEKSFDFFYKNSSASDGLSFWCKKCTKENKNKTRAEETAQPKKVKALLINFEGHPAIYDKLQKAADGELRTAEMQALYFLIAALT